jgi:hypothetical protein
MIHITVNTEINVGGNNFCNGDFTEDWHIVVNLTLLFGFINKCFNCKHFSGVTSLFEKFIKQEIYSKQFSWECGHTADIVTSNITKCRLHDKNILPFSMA